MIIKRRKGGNKMFNNIRANILLYFGSLCDNYILLACLKLIDHEYGFIKKTNQAFP